MKRLFMTILLIVAVNVWAQTATIQGIVHDEKTQLPLPGSNIYLEGTHFGTTSDEDGHFVLTNIPPGQYNLIVSYVGYKIFQQKITLKENESRQLTIALTPSPVPGEEVLVLSTRAEERKTPVVFTNLDASYIREVHSVEDIPMMLTEIPNVYAYADAGNSTGYTYLKVRGFDQKRIGVMINGIPLNDPEDHQVYWVDMPDFAESLHNIQFQRGVGSSLYGISTFGGSLNLLTSSFANQQQPEFYANYGSYQTRKYGAKFTIPFSRNRYIFHVRFSRLISNGYREHSGTNQWAVYTSLNRYGEKSFTQLNFYTGKEITQAAWYASPESILRTNRRYNPITYPNAVDNFSQPHLELHHTISFSPDLYWKNSLFYIHGIGYYESFKKNRNLWEYGLWPDPDNPPESDLIRQKWVEKNQYGWISQLDFRHPHGKLTLGSYLSLYNSDHWGEVDWVQKSDLENFHPDFRYYEYFGDKSYITLYANELLSPVQNLNVMANLHVQFLKYKFHHGKVANFTGPYRHEFEVTYQFINPRFGVNYNVSSHWNIFGNFSIAHREPADDELYDLWQGPDDLGVHPLFKKSQPVYQNGQIEKIRWSDPFVKPETLYDYELGAAFLTHRIQLRANLFYMAFKNEIVPYSQVDKDGFPIRGNADRTLHQGIELSLKAQLPLHLELSSNYARNRNIYKKFIQYNYNWDTGETTTQDLSGNTIAGFPDQLANVRLTYRSRYIRASLHWQHVGKQYLDNTNRNDRIIPAYSLLNASLALEVGKWFGVNKAELTLQLFNIQNTKYYTAGYYDSWEGENFYWPGAEFNWIAGIRIRL